MTKSGFFSKILDRIGASAFLSSDGSGQNLNESELAKLERQFSLMLFGQFLGRPSPPAPLLFPLLPQIQKEFFQLFDGEELITDSILKEEKET
ncbi:MAG TPA: hypothetical protein ENN84_00060 [Candidatus Marinimicrobia bacterium]|nr:hypothetical protein [Candidatus Neomarinimicrobiota bacterium]